ncbi:lipopolysaccharide biosynthesis protein [Streptomyces sp. MST-110588]|uniref:lipopolysaccharide biosynthesis protein n=1 Tax=Streptomyces sp. MST-110588 TaxID=2833628 RepID=UPI001F5CB4CA|nr:lipopolysaccharide biosynthesis protein [Streptomyces sp. MST-110588]UNO43237.1 lipopolysaccharide biosynthesis protein [Streptomyces sp. MST-110588]
MYAAVAPQQYTATSFVAVTPGKKTDPASALGYAQAYGRIATDPAVLVRARRGTALGVAELRTAVRADTSPDAPMIEITGTSARRQQAADISNAVAQALVRTVEESTTKTGAKPGVLFRALAPVEPVSPSPGIAVGVGGCAGGLIGALVLLARPQRRQPYLLGAPVLATAHHGTPGHAAAAPRETSGTTPAAPNATTGSATTSHHQAPATAASAPHEGTEQVQAAR